MGKCSIYYRNIKVNEKRHTTANATQSQTQTTIPNVWSIPIPITDHPKRVNYSRNAEPSIKQKQTNKKKQIEKDITNSTRTATINQRTT